MNKPNQLRMTNQNPEKAILQDQDKSVDNIWEKLKRRAVQVGYGSLICEI